MRAFELDNVIKKTDNETKIKKYLAQGFKEVGAKSEEKKAETKKG